MRYAWLVVAVLACKGASSMTLSEKQFRAWLEAFDSGDRAKLDAYHQASFPWSAMAMPIDLDQEFGFRMQTGGFEIRQIEDSTASKVTVLVQERNSEQFARAIMEVDAAGKVSHFGIEAIPTPEAFQPKRLGEAQAIQALQEELGTRVAADRFAGAVLVARRGTPIFEHAYGLADREHQVANTLDTKFRIGSMNKMFTATAIVHLVQDGKLALTDTVGKARPGYPNAAIANVTIEQLLTHTGATGDIFGPEFGKHRLELDTIDAYLSLDSSRALDGVPGNVWNYSNYGFILLGAIIESVTHETYYEHVAKHVFEPAGMTSTDSPPEGQPAARRAVAYMHGKDGTGWVPATDTLPARASSAGGGLSTVHDLLAFANALQAHKLLDEEHTKMLTTGRVPMPEGGKYAFGFKDDTQNGVRCFGHDGGAPGMNGSLLICDSGYTIAVLSNLDPPAAQDLARFIQVRLPASARD